MFWVQSGFEHQQFTKFVYKASFQVFETLRPMRYPASPIIEIDTVLGVAASTDRRGELGLSKLFVQSE